MSKIRSEQILANEILGVRKEMPGEETDNKYGDSAREIEIGNLGKLCGFKRILFNEIPNGGIIESEFIYEMKKKKKKSVQGIAETCIDRELRLDARLQLKIPQEEKENGPKNQRYKYRS